MDPTTNGITNTSNRIYDETFPNKISSSLIETGFAITYLGTAFTIAVIGNGRIIFIICRKECYHLPYFYIIASYAVADIIQALTSIPIMFFAFVINEGFDVPEFVCALTGILSPGMVFISFHILTLMALERYYYFVRPLKYPLLFTTRNVIIIEAILWSLMLLFSTGIHFADPRKFYTSVIQCQSPSAGIIIYIQIICYLLPALIGALFSIIKLWSLRTSHQARVQDNTDKNNKSQNKQRGAALKIIILTSGLFWITYLPPGLFRMIVFARGITLEELDKFTSPELSYSFRYLNIVLFTLSSVINPFIYLYTHKPLRRHFFGRFYWVKQQDNGTTNTSGNVY